MNQSEPVLVHLDGEIPKFGCGRRALIVESVGPKWATVYYPATNRRAKVRRPAWDKIVKAKRNKGRIAA